jgi:hypothetical protein
MPLLETDAVNGAGWQAKLAARAMRRNDRMHHLRYANNGIDGAYPTAEIAADAKCFVDNGNLIQARMPLCCCDR